MNYELIAIVGPTASGKTRRAVALARALHTEIISADSRQVYRGMDIGTGKDMEEYGEVPSHILDVRPAGYKYNLHEYLQDFRSAFDAIRAEGRMPLICGGTGMYVEAAINGLALPEVPENPGLRASLKGKGLDELTLMLSSMKQLHNTTDVDTCARAVRAIEIETWYQQHPQEAAAAKVGEAKKLNALIIGVDIPREERRKRISKRLDARLHEGMIAEVQRLLDSGIPPEDLIYYGLEYKFVTRHLIGELSYQEMRDSLEIAIHQFAKRQMTWFRGMERRGHIIHWLPYDLEEEEFTSQVLKLLEA